MFQDEWVLEGSWPQHPDLPDREELLEDRPVPLPVLVQEMAAAGIARTAEAVRRHRKAAIAIGAASLGSLGFATGALAFSHRH